MKNVASLGFAFALALTGCASDRNGDDDVDPGTEQPDPQEPTKTLDLVGSYRVNSTFDLATSMPGTSGAVVNGLIAATDGPDDPMSWVVDQMLAQMQPGTFKDILTGAKPFVIGYLNDRVSALAPDLVGTLLDLGMRMEDVMKDFGLNEKLVVSFADQTYLGQMTADGVRFTQGTVVTDVLFADHDTDDVVAQGIFIQFQNQTTVTIGEHTMALPYAKIARMALDAAVIPAIDPTASSLTDLLDHLVDCQGVGASVASSLGFGSPSLYAGACHAGLDKAADAIYAQLITSDSKLNLKVAGTARASDANLDYKVDKLSSGNWTGTMTYETATAPLAQPAAFVGIRM